MKLYDLLKVLSEPSRLKILYCLNTKKLYVNELQTILDLSQANVSKHLKMLYEAEIVLKNQVNQKVAYELNPEYIDTCIIFKPLMDAFEQSEDGEIIKKKLKLKEK